MRLPRSLDADASLAGAILAAYLALFAALAVARSGVDPRPAEAAPAPDDAGDVCPFCDIPLPPPEPSPPLAVARGYPGENLSPARGGARSAEPRSAEPPPDHALAPRAVADRRQLFPNDGTPSDAT